MVDQDAPNESPRWMRLLFGGRPTLWHVLVPLTFVLAGLIFATSANVAQGRNIRSSGGDLVGLVREQERTRSEREAALTRLQNEVATLTPQQGPARAQVQALQTKIDAMAPAAGLEAVQGPAVKVTLRDSDRPVSSFNGAYTANDLVIHQQDVQAFVNALWAGGAEAMMIQDQRVISTSAVRCVGNTLYLQGRVYSPPFTITAMGDPTKLQAALDADSQVAVFREYVAAVGLGLDVAQATQTTFPAYAGSITLRHATVVK